MVVIVVPGSGVFYGVFIFLMFFETRSVQSNFRSVGSSASKPTHSRGQPGGGESRDTEGTGDYPQPEIILVISAGVVLLSMCANMQDPTKTTWEGSRQRSQPIEPKKRSSTCSERYLKKPIKTCVVDY